MKENPCSSVPSVAPKSQWQFLSQFKFDFPWESGDELAGIDSE